MKENKIKRGFTSIRKHKLTALVILVAILAAGYFIWYEFKPNSSQVSYQVEKVNQGDIETIISTAGQVGDSGQIDITAEVSGEVIKVSILEGQEVVVGDLIAQIDSSDLESSIYQAQISLESAQLNLEEMKEPVDENDVTKAENAVVSSQNNLAELILQQEHQMEAALEEKEGIEDDIADLDEEASDYDTKYDTYQSQLKSVERKIEEYELSHPNAIEELGAIIAEKEVNLVDVKMGNVDENDLRLQELNVAEKQSKLDDLIADRSLYNITAPKNGVIAELNVSEGENVSSGSSNNSTALAVLITYIKNAEVTINEVDVPNIEAGQKTVLTFDAFEDVELTGTVEKIDLIGTNEQGVVYNNAVIAFDTQDSRIRNGMSVSVDIITESKKDILLLSSSAIQSQSNGDYVELVMSNDMEINNSSIIEQAIQTKFVKIETGITDDIYIEIVSGVNQGDVVVLKTITSEIDNSDDASSENDDMSDKSMMQMFNTGGKGQAR